MVNPEKAQVLRLGHWPRYRVTQRTPTTVFMGQLTKLALLEVEPADLDIVPEAYDANDRVPRRDPRGSARSDSSRRDLTIGSMLLQVKRRPPSRRRGLGWGAVLAIRPVR